MEYNDVKGATKCKTCPLGSIPVQHHKCIECNPGFYGTAEGECKSCMINGPTSYSEKGASVCKTCPLGMYSRNQQSCERCWAGSRGTSRGCVSCRDDGPRHFNDVEGATTCKVCPENMRLDYNRKLCMV